MAADRWLLIETSGREGRVGLGAGDTVLAHRQLDATRRHARDLVPAVQQLMQAAGWRPRDFVGIGVSLGPGSYTGLRVGIMAAKAFAYALGCRLVGVPTFAVIARRAPASMRALHVVADALKGKLYDQRFVSTREGAWTPEEDLRIVDCATWLAQVRASCVTGPGVELVESALPPGVSALPPESRRPDLGALLELARSAPAALEGHALQALEPLYWRASSAEEQWSSGSQPRLSAPGACTSPN